MKNITLYVELIPIFIFSFLIMSAFANQNILKAAVWLVFTIVGLFAVSMAFKSVQISPQQETNIVFPFFAKYYLTCSTSIFLISYTFVYLLMPMIYAKNMNYAIIFLFVAFYLGDVLGRKYIQIPGVLTQNMNPVGVTIGTLCGVVYGILCFFIIYKAGDKYLYFSTSTSSTGEYCSKPANQQFKCNVYKNGQLISTI
jgi:hypothetical protein